MIQSNGRGFLFRSTPQEAGWYPERCDVGAMDFCEKRGLLGPVCVDVGAHCGLYTLLMATNPDVKEVVAIEANEDACRVLAANVNANAYQLSGTKIHAWIAVVGNGQPATFDYCSAKPDPYGGPTIALNSLPMEPDFIKIDVEGFEEQVLSGADKWLRGRSNFYIELHPNVVSDYGFLWDYIDQSAYETTRRGNELFGLRLAS